MSLATRATVTDHPSASTPPSLTSEIANWVSTVGPDDFSERTYERAKHALLDWFGVTLAGASEPLTRMLIDELTHDQPRDASMPCSIIWHDHKTSLLNAALINGAASHALDYDDVNRALHGHPSVVVVPAALAVSEHLGSSGRDCLAAIIVGTEVAARIASCAGDGHYESGWHATGTIGTFGAAAAAANLLGCDRQQTARALGIAASQAAGLKCNFGTMTKPFHAGKAAYNGVLAARLAMRGFTASEAAIEAPQGSVEASMPGFVLNTEMPAADDTLAVEANLFKYHAACYMTHAALEAVSQIRTQHNVNVDDLETMRIEVHPQHDDVCNIMEPTTGLQIKFSIRHCAVMGLDGHDTGSLETYSDENAKDPRYVEARRKVTVDMAAHRDRLTATVLMTTRDGRELKAFADVGSPEVDPSVQEKLLRDKYLALTIPVIGETSARALIDAIAMLNGKESLEAMIELARPE